MDPIPIQFPILPAAAADELTATDLKPDLIEEILTWAPAKTVIYLKSVCKLWQLGLDNPVFARLHFSRATLCPLLISGGKVANRPCRIMHLVEGSDLESRTCVISRFDIRSRAAREHAQQSSFNSKFKVASFCMDSHATSCEGLLFWMMYDHYRGGCITISNPITREYVSLSLPMDEDKVYAFVGMGFRRVIKKFELLRMAASFDDDEDDLFWWPEVCGVGDSSWRRVDGGVSRYAKISQVVYVDGSIYWCYVKDVAICCFNFDKAMFQIVAILPEMSPRLGSLGVLDGALCLSQICPMDGHVEVFVLEKVGAGSELQWKKLCDVHTETTQLEHQGVLWPRGEYKAIKRLSSGEILMHDWRGKFIIYDPLTKQEKRVCVLDESRLARNDGLGLDDLLVVSHVPCIVGLKEALNVDGLQLQVWEL